MAIAYIALVLRGVHTLIPVEKLILVILSDYSRAPAGMSWPSVETIAWEACIGRRQATAHLARLRATGWIEAVGSHRGGRGKSTCYRLNLQRIAGYANDAKAIRGAKKDARDRAVKERLNNADSRALSGRESMRNPAAKHAATNANHADSCTESMRPAAHEPLGLAVIQPEVSRTSKPGEKSLDPNPEKPNSNSETAPRTAEITEEPTEAQIQARGAEKARQLRLVATRIAKG